MKIEQLNQLNKNITAEQLEILIDESDTNINEYLRIQKFFDGLKVVFSKDMQNKYVEYLYKLSTNQYTHIVNVIMKNLEEFTTSEVYSFFLILSNELLLILIKVLRILMDLLKI